MQIWWSKLERMMRYRTKLVIDAHTDAHADRRAKRQNPEAKTGLG